MEAPKYWNYDAATREYRGTGIADPSPAEEGVFLFPAYSTQVELPTIPHGYTAVFDDTDWELVEDHRGESWYIAGVLTEIRFLGLLPPDATQEPPPSIGPNQVLLWVDGAWKVEWDYRGQIWWKSYADWQRITELGDPTLLGLSPIQPPALTPAGPNIPEGALTKRQVTRAMVLGAQIMDPDEFMLNAMNAIPEPTQRALAREDWKYAPYFLRSHELFSNEPLLAAAGMNPEMVDQLWALGLTQPQ